MADTLVESLGPSSVAEHAVYGIYRFSRETSEHRGKFSPGVDSLESKHGAALALLAMEDVYGGVPAAFDDAEAAQVAARVDAVADRFDGWDGPREPAERSRRVREVLLRDQLDVREATATSDLDDLWSDHTDAVRAVLGETERCRDPIGYGREHGMVA